MGIPSIKHPFVTDIPTGYRTLQENEVVKPADMLWNTNTGAWVSANKWIDSGSEELARNFRTAIRKT